MKQRLNSLVEFITAVKVFGNKTMTILTVCCTYWNKEQSKIKSKTIHNNPKKNTPIQNNPTDNQKRS